MLLTYLLVGLLFVFVFCTLVGFIKPRIFKFLFKSNPSRLRVGLTFALLSLATFIMAGIFGQNSAHYNNLEVITHPKSNEDYIWGQLFQGALANTSIKFAEAHIYTSALLNANPKKISKQDWLKLGKETKKKWMEAESASNEFSIIAQAMPDYAAPMISMPLRLVETAYAADPSFREFYKHREKIKKDQEYNSKLNAIDVAPGKDRVKTAAKLFATDITKAKDIVDNFYGQVASNEIEFSDMMDAGSKASNVISTSAEVAIFVGGLYTGASELALLGKANKIKSIANIIAATVSGTNLALDVAETGVEVGIFNEEFGATIAAYKENKYLKALSTLVSIKDLKKALSSFADLKKLIGKSSNGEISQKSIKDFLSSSEDVAKAVDKIKEDGLDNLKTTYDWTSWFGSQSGKSFAEYFEIPGLSSITLEQGENTEIKENVSPVILNKGTIPTSLVIRNGKVAGMFSLKDVIAKKTVPVSKKKEKDSSAQGENENYNGTYSGKSNASSGITYANVSVQDVGHPGGGILSGSGNYLYTYPEGSYKVRIAVSGTVSKNGDVNGSISASSTVGNSSFSSSGKISGIIENGAMKLSYSISGSAIQGSGKINLRK